MGGVVAPLRPGIAVLADATVDFIDMGLRRAGVRLEAFLVRQQCFAVRDRDLVVVGMDFAKGKKSMAVAAVIDKRRLQRGFDPRHLGKIDIALKLFFGGCLDVVFFETIAVHNDDAHFFGVRAIDQHAH